MSEPHEWLPLDTVRDSFHWLVAGPSPVSVDGRQFTGLPDRLIPLNELRNLLLSKQCGNSTRDDVWTYLVERSRVESGTWTVACAGMALPALASSASWLANRFRGDRADVHAAVLVGFLDALTHIDLDQPGILIRLVWAARRAGHAALAESLDAPRPVDPELIPDQKPPSGHPDLVLARAVGEGVLTAIEADLILSTRLGDTTVTAWARARRHGVKAVFKARDRAEDRLLVWLREQPHELDSDPVAAAALAAIATVLAAEDDHDRSRSVSGRYANGRPIRTRSASKTTPAAGLLGREENTNSPRTAPESEVRRCA
jgi:hypothetical protein